MIGAKTLVNDPIVIVGMGPGGMIAAIESAKKGHNVVIIENRDHFTRSQRVIMKPESIDYLVDLVANSGDDQDLAFIRKLASEHTVQVNLLQDFLEKQLQRYPAQIEIRKGKNHQVLAVNVGAKTNSVIIESDGKKEAIQFSHLVGADGARHTLSNQLTTAAKNSAGKFSINYQDLEQQTRQEPHGTVSLRYKENAMLFGGLRVRDKPRDLTYEDLPILQKVGWDEPYLPKIYMFENEDKTNFYLAGEIPRSILDAKKADQPRLMTEWGTLILKLQEGFHDVNENIEFDISDQKDARSIEENKLRATAFPVTLQYTDTPCLSLPSGSAFALLGDASKNANFHLGHGANDAIEDGRVFARCLHPNGFDVEAFSQHQKDQKKHMTTAMQSLDHSMTREYKSIMKSLAQDVQTLEKDMRVQVRSQAHILFALAKLHPDDKALQAAVAKCEKIIKAKDFNYDEVYLSTLLLADQLNKKADQLTPEGQKIAATQKEMDATAKQIAQKQKELQQLNKPSLFKAIRIIVSSAGAQLQKQNELAKLNLENEIKNLEKKQGHLAKKQGLESKALKDVTNKQQPIINPVTFGFQREKLQSQQEKLQGQKDKLKEMVKNVSKNKPPKTGKFNPH